MSGRGRFTTCTMLKCSLRDCEAGCGRSLETSRSCPTVVRELRPSRRARVASRPYARSRSVGRPEWDQQPFISSVETVLRLEQGAVHVLPHFVLTHRRWWAEAAGYSLRGMLPYTVHGTLRLPSSPRWPISHSSEQLLRWRTRSPCWPWLPRW